MTFSAIMASTAGQLQGVLSPLANPPSALSSLAHGLIALVLAFTAWRDLPRREFPALNTISPGDELTAVTIQAESHRDSIRVPGAPRHSPVPAPLSRYVAVPRHRLVQIQIVILHLLIRLLPPAAEGGRPPVTFHGDYVSVATAGLVASFRALL